MVNINAQDRRIQYTGNGTAGPFSFSFQVNATSEIKVYVDTTVKTITTHYTVSLSSDGSGSISFTTGNHPTNSQTITIMSNIPISRTSQFTTGGTLTADALETEFNNQFMHHQQHDQRLDRALLVPEHDTISGANFILPAKSSRLGKLLGFNSSTGNPEATFTVADGNTLAGISGDIATLADIEDGTDATDAIQTVAGIQANVTTVAGVAGNVTTVASNISNVNALAQSAVITDMSLLATTDVIADMALLANADVIADMNTLAVTDVINDINLLATSDIVSDLNTLATSDIVSDINTLATSDIVSDLNTLATSDIVSDINTLATSDIVADLALLATSDFVSDLNTMATTTNVNNLSTVAGAVTNVNTLAPISANITSVANIASDITSLANSLEKTYTVTVVNPGSGNVFALDGSNKPAISVFRGNKYIFNQTASTNDGHPLVFKNGGSDYEVGVTYYLNGSATTRSNYVNTTTFNAGRSSGDRKVEIEIASSAPSSGLAYVCYVHGSGMGNSISVSDSNISLVAGSITNINTVAGQNANITTLAGISSDITTLAGTTGLSTLASNASNINIVATNNTNVTNVGSNITNVNTVASNLTNVNNFANRYRIGSSNPTSSLDNGDLFFNTTSSTLLVYGSSGWQNAGSSVNGTSARFTYNISGTPSSVTGADANGNTLAYDAGFVDVYLNGARLSGADITTTSGDTITFASALANGDVVDIVAFGTFNVASINANNINAGTVPIARLGTSGTKDTTTFLRGDNTFAVVDTTNASNLSTGTLPNARLSSVPNSALANSSITINGSAISLGGSVTVETDFTWETKTANFNVNASRGYFVDTSSNAVTATLPASPTAGDTVRFIDLSATFDTANLTVARNGKKIQGDASDMTVATERAGFALVFSGDTQGWLLMEK